MPSKVTCPHDIIEKDNACADGMCPICLAAEIEHIRRSNEPNREPAYRKSQVEIRDRLANRESCITWLLVELRALQKRVTQLEKRNDDLAAAALRLAHSNAEEVRESAQP